MYKRIIIITHDGNRFTGDTYKVDKSSPVIYAYSPPSTKQEFEELEKLRFAYTIGIDEMKCWWSEELIGECRDNMRTVSEIFDTLTFEQKNRVYSIIGDILENNRRIDGKYVNLSFLSNQEQKNAVLLIIDQAIMDNRKNM